MTAATPGGIEQALGLCKSQHKPWDAEALEAFSWEHLNCNGQLERTIMTTFPMRICTLSCQHAHNFVCAFCKHFLTMF